MSISNFNFPICTSVPRHSVRVPRSRCYVVLGPCTVSEDARMLLLLVLLVQDPTTNDKQCCNNCELTIMALRGEIQE